MRGIELEIRESSESDLIDVLRVERQAFGSDEESELANNLLSDSSAAPLLSLIALDDEQAIGHILFTKARLADTDNSVASVILAPLAVIPKEQGKGVGGKLIERGLSLLSESGVELVFVLGDPRYYTRHKFRPAGPLGFDAPYPLPKEYIDMNAWMVQELHVGMIARASGKVVCADALAQPEYWIA